MHVAVEYWTRKPVCPKPTPEFFRRNATNCLRFSRTPIPLCGDEYYSRCGEEDHHAMRREDARREAIESYRTWKLLTGKA